MTEEEKQAALEAENKAKEEAEAQANATKEAQDAEFEAGIAELSDEEKEAKRAEREANKNPDNADYKAQLERERKAREDAEKALADRRFKDSERKRKEREAGGEGKTLTADQLDEILAREREETRKEIQSTQIREIAGRLATSEAQRDLIVEIHKNRTFPSHLSLEEQIEEAYAISNSKKLIGERNEAMRALRGKDAVNKNPASTHRDAPVPSAPKLKPADEQALTAAGFVYNGTTRRLEKKLPNGDILVRLPGGGTAIVKRPK